MIKSFIFLLGIIVVVVINSCMSISPQKSEFIENISNNDTLNKYNEKGKKQGFWIMYLSDKLLEVKNKEKAVCYCYVYYRDGHLMEGGLLIIVNKRTSVFSDEELIQNKDRLIQLNGTYKTYIKKNKVITCEYVFRKGILLKIVDYKKGIRKCINNFEEKANDDYYSYSVTLNDKKGKMIEKYNLIYDDYSSLIRVNHQVYK